MNVYNNTSVSFDLSVSRDDVLLELDHEGRALVPVSRDLRRKVAAIEDGLDDAGREGRTVERSFVLRNRDELVDQWLLLDDVVSLLVVVGVLELVSLLSEQSLPQSRLDHEENVEKLRLATSRSIPNEDEIENPSPDLPSEFVKLLLKFRNGRAPALAILNHFGEEKGEGRKADFLLAAAQRFVQDVRLGPYDRSRSLSRGHLE